MNNYHDNKQGMLICSALLVVDTLPQKEREFLSSIQHQISAHPRKFQLSTKQWAWLKGLWDRYYDLRRYPA